MRRTGRRTGESTDGQARRTVRAHVAGSVLVAIISSALIAAGMLGAPLVSVLLIGVLLVCPLLMWMPFRFEQKTRDELISRGRNGSA